MLRRSRSSVSFLAVLFTAVSVLAQDNQYWTQQHGAHAQLMGGAMIAGTDDQSVLFYNPAAMAFVKSNGITASTSFIYYQKLSMKDVSGYGLSSSDASADNSPRLVAGAFDAGPRWRISLGFVSAVYSGFEMDAANSVELDAYPNVAGSVVLRGLTNNSTEVRDDQIGLGASYALSERSAIGATLFGSSFVQRFAYVNNVSIFPGPSSSDPATTLADLGSVQRGEVENLGFVLKLGYLHRNEGVQWGASVALPRWSTHFWEGSMYRSATGRSVNGAVISDLYYSEELATRYHTPWMLDAGLQVQRGRTLLAVRFCYSTAVEAYDRMTLTQADAVYPASAEGDEPVLRVRSANRSLVNGAVGATYRLSDKADVIAGLRSDLNYFDQQALDRPMDVSGTLSFWDLYHASAGVDLHSERVKLTAGLVYAFGSDTGTPEQLLAVDDRVVTSISTVQFKTGFQQIGFTFGFSYFVLGDRKPATSK
ncbi:MAG: hypothetical protein ACK46G_11340 [Flavobacteriales bacterium]|jgi:hypothetical protein